MTQPFAFGGEEGSEAFDASVRYRSGLQNYLIDEDADLQETNQDLELIELIGLQNWLVLKLNGTEASAE